MARRGRFGRMPAAQPSLANTIVSIAREMQNQRDQNLMSAWQKGGTFEGQKATDELVLAHWRERLKGIDKDDPLADTYRNTVTQYEYAIAESKQSTLYAQGKISDGAMAAFYTSWAKKVPVNSEFYRVLQRDAAQFMRSAAAKGKAAAAEAKERAYAQAQAKTQKDYEAAGDYLTSVLRNLAQSGALIGASGNTNADLSDFDPRDPEKMMRLFSYLSAPDLVTPWNGSGTVTKSTVLFHDPLTGNAVTAADIQARLKQLDPHFDGRLTMDYLRQTLSRQSAGVDIRLQRATDTGHATDVNNLKGLKGYVTEIARETKAWPAAVTYQQYRQTFLATWNNPTATPQEKLAAWTQYATSINGLANDPALALDDNTKSRLVAEATGDGSVQSLAESFTGLQNADNTTTGTGFKGDIADTFADVQKFQAQVDAVTAGQAFWTTGVEKNGVFEPTPGGPMIGAATLDQISNASPVKPVVVMLPQGAGQQPTPVLVTGVNVDATARNADGTPVPVANKNPIAQVYDVTIGGFRARVYGFTGSDGKTYYSTDKPWGNVPVHEDGSGVHLDLSALVPYQDPTSKQWVYPSGQAADTSGKYGIGLSEPQKTTGEQHVVIDPRAVALNTDAARAASGPDPTTDFFSPTLAALMSTPEGTKVLASLRDNDAFKAQIDRDAHIAAGFQQDPTTGAWAGGDQSLLNKFTSQASMATNIPGAAEAATSFIRDAYKAWGRFTTAPTFDLGAKSTPSGPAAVAGERNIDLRPTVAPLPSDSVRGTAFGALGDVFQQGTNLIRSIVGSAPNGLPTITTPTSIKVPNVNAQTGFMTPTPPTTTSVTPIVTTTPVTPVVTTTPAPGTTPLPGSSTRARL